MWYSATLQGRLDLIVACVGNKSLINNELFGQLLGPIEEPEETIDPDIFL